MLRDTSLASPLDNDFVPHYVFLLFLRLSWKMVREIFRVRKSAYLFDEIEL